MLLAATYSFFMNANALVNEVELPLFAYHINNNATYKDAPNKLDSNATFVANPGLLVGLDTRKDTKTDGFSFLAKGGFLQDCANKTVFALGGGGRYRHFLTKNFSFDGNAYLMGANAVTNFGTNMPDERSFVVLPLLNIGFNYHLKSNKSVGFTVSYIPQNTAIAATSGTDLLFFTVNMGF